MLFAPLSLMLILILLLLFFSLRRNLAAPFSRDMSSHPVAAINLVHSSPASRLHKDGVTCILAFLPLRSLPHAALTCTRWYNVVDSLPPRPLNSASESASASAGLDSDKEGFTLRIVPGDFPFATSATAGARAVSTAANASIASMPGSLLRHHISRLVLDLSPDYQARVGLALLARLHHLSSLSLHFVPSSLQWLLLQSLSSLRVRCVPAQSQLQSRSEPEAQRTWSPTRCVTARHRLCNLERLDCRPSSPLPVLWASDVAILATLPSLTTLPRYECMELMALPSLHLLGSLKRLHIGRLLRSEDPSDCRPTDPASLLSHLLPSGLPPRLEQLEISDVRHPIAADAMELEDAARKLFAAFTSVRALRLTRWQLTSLGFLASMPQLTQLSLVGCCSQLELSTEQLEHVIALPRLQRLHLDEADARVLLPTDDDVQSMRVPSRRMPQLACFHCSFSGASGCVGLGLKESASALPASTCDCEWQ